MKNLKQKGVLILDYMAVIAVILAIIALYPDFVAWVHGHIELVLEFLHELFLEVNFPELPPFI